MSNLGSRSALILSNFSLPPSRMYICPTTVQFFPPSLPYILLSYYCPIFPSLPPILSRIARTLPYVEYRSLLNGKNEFFLTNMNNPPPSGSASGDIFYCQQNAVDIIVSQTLDIDSDNDSRQFMMSLIVGLYLTWHSSLLPSTPKKGT